MGTDLFRSSEFMLDFGIRCIIAPTFAEIFQNNCCSNGILPIALSPELCALSHEDAVDAIPLEIVLEAVEIRRTSGESPVKIQVEPLYRHCLLQGLDDIGIPLYELENIEKFERHRSKEFLWLDGTSSYNCRRRCRLASRCNCMVFKCCARKYIEGVL
jgi:3-isopropylmalate dehydratase